MSPLSNHGPRDRLVPSLRYGGVAIGFHWVLALVIIANFALGVYMHELPISPSRIKLFNYHKWAGISIMTLSALRLLWRLSHRPPADLPMPAWQAKAAHALHTLLYVLFFAVPLSGWAYSSAAGFPVVLYGVIPLPDFVAPDKALADTLKGLHKLFTLSLGGLVLVHVAAAVKHQWVDRDGVMARMGLGPAQGSPGSRGARG
jgi:cytochrome b561